VAERTAKHARHKDRSAPATHASRATAFAPIDHGDAKVRVILPAPFDRDAAQEPLDLSAAAQAPTDAKTETAKD
jgi:hypothetical protein